MTLTEEDVQARLQEWARYVLGGLSSRFLGLPGHCTYLEFIIKSTDRTGREIPERVWETDRAIRELGEMHPELRTAVEIGYLSMGTREEQAGEAGVSESTLLRRIDRAIQYLITLLNSRK